MFDNEDCHYPQGFIQVVLDQPYYEPGGEVTGNVYLRITDTISGVKGIKFEMKGGGKNAFTRFWHETIDHEDGT